MKPELVYLDTETTGLHPQDGDGLVEIALVDDAGQPLLNTLVNPERQIPREVTQIHGITNAMVATAPARAEVLPQVLERCRGKTLVIYNAPFDLGFLPELKGEAAEVHCCMQRFARWYGGRRRWQKLSLAAQVAGHVWEGLAHRALADAQACRSVWRFLDVQTLNPGLTMSSARL